MPDGTAAGWSAHAVLPDGQVLTQRVLSFEPATGRIALSPGLPAAPLTGAMCVLEHADAPSTLWRVRSVRETGGPGLEFEARQYDPGRHAAVEAGLRLAEPAPESDEAAGPLPAPAQVSLQRAAVTKTRASPAPPWR